MGFRISKWQRLILAIGAIAFLIRAVTVVLDENSDHSPTLPFLASIALGVFALNPQSDDEVLPYIHWLKENWKKGLVSIGIIAGVIVVGSIAAEFTRRPADELASAYATDAPWLGARKAVDEAAASDAAVAASGAAAAASDAAALGAADINFSGMLPKAMDPASMPGPTFYNPSFDCNGKLTNVLRMICQSEDLSQKDRQLSAKFKDIIAESNGDVRQDLLKNQRSFLSDRDNCQDNTCLSDWYDLTIKHYSENQ